MSKLIKRPSVIRYYSVGLCVWVQYDKGEPMMLAQFSRWGFINHTDQTPLEYAKDAASNLAAQLNAGLDLYRMTNRTTGDVDV